MGVRTVMDKRPEMSGQSDPESRVSSLVEEFCT